jgi:Holliday junction resolvase
MARQRESKLSGRILTALRANGVFCFKVHGSEHMMAGLPDIVACVEGQFLGLEIKLPGEEKATSPRQDWVHGLIRQAQGRVEVVTSVQEALALVQRMRAETKTKRR